MSFLEPLGNSREAHFEQRLLLSLAWYCTTKPTICSDDHLEWEFIWDPPVEGIRQRIINIQDDSVISFEKTCSDLESDICDQHLDIVCKCCCLDKEGVCNSCQFAVGFHRCEHASWKGTLWRKGTLHDGVADVERVLFNLHRKHVPLDKLKAKAIEYVAANHIDQKRADAVIRVIEEQRCISRTVNDVFFASPCDASPTSALTASQLVAELRKREEQMKTSDSEGGVTDQWRIFQEIIDCLTRGEYLRMMVQASCSQAYSELS